MFGVAHNFVISWIVNAHCRCSWSSMCLINAHSCPSPLPHNLLLLSRALSPLPPFPLPNSQQLPLVFYFLLVTFSFRHPPTVSFLFFPLSFSPFSSFPQSLTAYFSFSLTLSLLSPSSLPLPPPPALTGLSLLLSPYLSSSSLLVPLLVLSFPSPLIAFSLNHLLSLFSLITYLQFLTFTLYPFSFLTTLD